MNIEELCRISEILRHSGGMDWDAAIELANRIDAALSKRTEGERSKTDLTDGEIGDRVEDAIATLKRPRHPKPTEQSSSPADVGTHDPIICGCPDCEESRAAAAWARPDTGGGER